MNRVLDIVRGLCGGLEVHSAAVAKKNDEDAKGLVVLPAGDESHGDSASGANAR